MTPRVLLIGLGRWGRQHLRALVGLGADVYAADLDATNLEAAAAVLPSDHLSDDFRRLLERVDAVDVVTPAPDHFWICQAALLAGKDVFVEKPITATLKEARELVEQVRAGTSRLQVGHVFRFHPVYEQLTALLAAGRIGRIRAVGGRFQGLKRPRPDGGVTASDAIHVFDLVTDLLGAPRTVTAVLHDFLGRGLDDWGVTVIEFQDALATVAASYFAPETRRDLTVIGEHGALVADFAGWTLTEYPGHHRRNKRGWEIDARSTEIHAVDNPDEPLRRELRAFLDGIDTRHPPLVGAEAGYRALLLASAAKVASIEGRRVRVEEIEP
jgi:predicted dehydrogenase